MCPAMIIFNLENSVANFQVVGLGADFTPSFAPSIPVKLFRGSADMYKAFTVTCALKSCHSRTEVDIVEWR